MPSYPVRVVLRPRGRSLAWFVPQARRDAFEACLAERTALQVEWERDAIAITGSLEGAARVSARQDLEVRVERCVAVAEVGSTIDLEPAYMIGG